MKRIELKYYILITLIALTLIANTRLIYFTNFAIDFLYGNNSAAALIPVGVRIDYFFVFVLYIAIAVYLALRWRSSLLNKKIKFSNGLMIALFLFIALFPFISGYQSNVSRESIKISKLPPFTKLNCFTKVSDENNQSKNYDKLFLINDRNPFIYFDSYKTGKQIKYSFNGEEGYVDKKILLSKDNLPVVSARYFIMGTDEFGNDLLIEILFGIRKSFFVAILASILSMFIGSILGYFSGTHTDFSGSIINRITESVFSIPSILLFIIILLFWGSSVISVAIILGLTGWITIFKIIRNEVILITQKEFYQTSVMLGLSKSDLLKKEILPGLSAQLSVSFIFMFMNFIIFESSISFIGLGSEESYSSLGSIIQRGNYYLPHYYWITLFPMLSLAAILISLNAVKYNIRKNIDPRIK
jgi:ABC-type dipeptide/oligopeptide/nickel transport system permease subunit